ncbi:MAG TPA: hypothetical protein VF336_01170 [Syntrophales bacterium]
MEYSPDHRKGKISARALVSLVLGIIFAGGVILFVLKPGFGKWGRESLVGKVVELDGTVKDVGVVERYKKNRSIVIKSVDDGFTRSVYYDLSGKHSIRILADNVAGFLKSHKVSPSRSEDIQLVIDNQPQVLDVNTLEPKFEKIKKMRFEDLRPESVIPDKIKTTIGSVGENQNLFRENLKLYTDFKLEEGVAIFEKKIIGLAGKADRMDGEWRRYKDICLGRSSAGNPRGREGGGTLEGPGRATNEPSPECLKIYGNFIRLSEEIREEMSDTLEEASRNGLQPALIEKIRKKYRMDWGGGGK